MDEEIKVDACCDIRMNVVITKNSLRINQCAVRNFFQILFVESIMTTLSHRTLQAYTYTEISVARMKMDFICHWDTVNGLKIIY